MVFVNVAKGRLLSEGYRPDEVSAAEYVRPHSPSKKQGSRVWVGEVYERVCVPRT